MIENKEQARKYAAKLIPALDQISAGFTESIIRNPKKLAMALETAYNAIKSDDPDAAVREIDESTLSMMFVAGFLSINDLLLSRVDEYLK